MKAKLLHPSSLRLHPLGQVEIRPGFALIPLVYVDQSRQAHRISKGRGAWRWDASLRKWIKGRG